MMIGLLILLPLSLPGAVRAAAANDRLQEARSFEQRRDYAGAVDALKRILALRPRDADIEAELGHDYDELGRCKEAAAAYALAIEARPGDYVLRVSLAQDYVRLGKLAAARQEFAAARKIDGKARDAYILEGYADARSGDNAAAEKAFQAFLTAAPDDPAANHHMATFLADSGRLAEAERYMRKALALLLADPKASTEDVTHANVWLGRILEREGRMAEAEAAYLQGWLLVKDLGDHGYRVAIGCALAGLYLREGRRKEAEATLLTEAAECPPSQSCYANSEHASALSALASLYADEGRIAEARRTADSAWAIYERADHINPIDFKQHALALLQTAQTYARIGDKASAAGIYRRLLGFKDELRDARLLERVSSSLGALGEPVNRE